jgi:hypothetical protein
VVDSDVDGVDRGDGAGTDDKALTLFGPNYPKLRELKKMYDAEMLFSKWFVIRP